jgi:hypothetical protein
MADLYEGKPVQILTINPVNRKSNVEADAKRFDLPFPVLSGEKTKIIIDFDLRKLPMLMIVGMDGKVLFWDRFASGEEMQEIIDPILEKQKD